MNDNVKKMALSGSALVLAIFMGLQTFVFGKNDLQTLKEDMVRLTERVAKLETPSIHE
jgi:thymidine phosphorylase